MNTLITKTSCSIYMLFVLSLIIIIPAKSETKDEVCANQKSGKAIVLIINAKLASEDEQYADWSYYLNDFSSYAGSSYAFFKIDTVAMKKIIVDSEKFKKKYSIIFMKKNKDSYFYEGPIVEPQVYRYVHLTYSEKQMPEHIKQFAPDIVDVRLKCEK